MTLKMKQVMVMLSSVVLSVALSSCNSNSAKSTNSFGLMGQTGSQTNATTQTWSYTYNNQNLVETAKDPNGNVTRYDYDSKNNLTRITNPLKQNMQFLDYTEDGNPQTIIDQNGVTTKLTYTIDGWLKSSTTDGAVTNFDYDNVGQVTKTTLPDNTSLSYVYDGARYLTEIHSADGTIKYTRDNAGNITNTEISGSNGVVYAEQRAYDEMNRVLKITTAISTQSFSYDNDDNVETSTDGRNNKSTFAYDGLQRLSSVTDAKNGNSKYVYNNSNNPDSPTSISDAKDVKTTYSYNGLGNLLKLVSKDSGTNNYPSYDGNGNLLQQQDAMGNTIAYDYDALDRPKTITYADSVDNTIFTYDNGTNAVGKLTKVQNGVSSNSYYYDARGNTTNEIQRIDNKDYSLTYAYDKADHLTNILYPSKNQVSYSYTNGQISKVIVNGKAININHLAFGPINQLEFPNGVTEYINYNTDFSIKSISAGSLINRDYSYYPNGMIKSISGVDNYDYDQINSLTKADNQNYTYYPQGQNRKSSTINGIFRSYSNSSTSNRQYSMGDGLDTLINYDFDSAGNIIRAEPTDNLDNSINYVYDGLNRLKEVTIGDDQKKAKTLANYQYNSFSQRILKNVNGNKTIFIYNTAGQLLEEQNLAQNVTKDYVYADNKLIAIMENGQNIYIITDHLNAPQVVMDSTGRSMWSAKYDPFGRATIISNYKLNLRADGQYQDDETGLYYNWYRYYSPTLGRYITSDPLGLQAGMNTYVYVNGNPINFMDPMGLNPFVIAGAEVGTMILPGYGTIAGAVIGGVGGYVIGDQISQIIDKSKNKEKAPGNPNGQHTDYCPGKNGDEWVKVEKGPKAGKSGWRDKWGRIWVPTNGKDDHGGDHWDVQPNPKSKPGTTGARGGNAMPPKPDEIGPSDRWRGKY